MTRTRVSAKCSKSNWQKKAQFSICQKKRIGEPFERATAKSPFHVINAEGVTDPVRWTLDQLKTRIPSRVAKAGYEDIAKLIDQRAIAQCLSRAEKDVFANVIVKIVISDLEANPKRPDTGNLGCRGRS